MRSRPLTVLLFATCALFAQVANAQQAGQDVFVKVDASNGIAVTGATSLPVNASARASWTVTTNECDVKVTLNLNASLPAGLTLLASLTPPRGAVTIGTKPLSTIGIDFVTGITRTYESASASCSGSRPNRTPP